MLTSLSFIFVFSFLVFFISAVEALSISVPSTGTAGQSLTVSWTRNAPEDPTKFSLLLRDLSLGDATGQRTAVESGGKKDGTIVVNPSEGSFLIEAYPDNSSTSVLASSNKINIEAARSAEALDITNGGKSPPHLGPGPPDKNGKEPGVPKPPDPKVQSLGESSIGNRRSDGSSSSAAPPAQLATQTVVASESTTVPLEDILSGSTTVVRPSPTETVAIGETTTEGVVSRMATRATNSPPTSPIGGVASKGMPTSAKAAIIISVVFAIVLLLMISILIAIRIRRKRRAKMFSEKDIFTTPNPLRSTMRVSMGYTIKTEAPNNPEWQRLSESERKEKQRAALRQLQAPKAGRNGSLTV